jgi:hypothetical protein
MAETLHRCRMARARVRLNDLRAGHDRASARDDRNDTASWTSRID